MKNNRPVNLSMGQVLAVNLKSPVAIASILHRLSGVVVFLLIPVLLWILDKSLSSPEGFTYVKEQIFGNFLVRFIVWVFAAGLIYHFIAGLKHLLADLGVAEELQSGRTAATVSLILSAIGIIAAFIWIVL
ncbi:MULTISPECIES: succinate dehydrogenase, cytochrome b556 subunit [unclassified Acinetobacter]|uniref:succinate dehydrogenase, cytochrome b556 subunit n=1 Tax=unclassified Acinetobacter TaxID=196816 RepID=UPI0035B9AD9A